MGYGRFLLMFSTFFGSLGEDVTIYRKLMLKAKFLCPFTSICDEAALIQSQPPEGTVPCCRNCSCQPECERFNSCCFPFLETGVHDVKRECLYPAISQHFAKRLKGKMDTYKFVVDVKKCKYEYIAVKKTKKYFSTTKTCNSSNLTNICDAKRKKYLDTSRLNDTNCGECYCNMFKKQEKGIEMLVLKKCVCDKPIGKDGNCSCGDIKIAPWGSMLPVYSRKTERLYKNPVCALCDGVDDGIVWTPVISCLDFLNTFQGMEFAPENSKDCTMNFVKPSIINASFLPKCVLQDRICNTLVFPIPRGLNMSARQIIDACESKFNSIYDDSKENVFCAVCLDVFTKPETICAGISGIKANFDRVTFVMTLDFLIKKASNPAKLLPRQIKIACSSTLPSDCREVLCPIGRIRDDRGICTYPMAYTYIYGYSINLRLVPVQQDIFDMWPLTAKKNVSLKHFSSPWSSNWVIGKLLLETNRLMSSGDLKNKSAFIVKLDAFLPDKNQTKILENVSNALKKLWVMKVEAISITLRSEVLEYSKITFDKINNRFIPDCLSNTKEFDNLPNWIALNINDQNGIANRNRNLIEVTEMLFCQQIIIDPILDAYELRDNKRLVYLKNKKRYIFEANFIYNLNGKQEVRVCVEDTDFMIPSASVFSKNLIVINICTFVLHHVLLLTF